MKLLHQIGDRKHGANFNTLEEILACDEPLSFDGIYASVYEHYKALEGKSITFFVMGKYIGGDNSFDKGQPLSKYCTLEQIFEMAKYLNAKIGYHGWEHRRCVGLTDEEYIQEIAAPIWLTGYLRDFGWTYEDILMRNAPLEFAWPYGDYDVRAQQCLQSFGYQRAWSVTQGDGGIYSLKRSHLNW